jgi:peptidoglycan/LPS O-acetylase OafA/YrhL
VTTSMNKAVPALDRPDHRAVGTVAKQRSSSQSRQTPGVGARRDRYIDTLRAGALLRVIVYHTFGFAWLPFVFPSMGIMFALAGGLVAASLDRAQHNPWQVLGKRARRLLPPLWMLGIVLVPIMIVHGWIAVADEGGVPLDAWALLHWVVPLGDPGASDWGYQFTTPLWYIRAYFWFLLLSPAALFMFRRWPKRTMSVPLIVAVLSGLGLADFSLQGSPSSAIVATMATFGACWMLGFAHHDGTLRHLSLRWVVPTSLALIVIGTWWTATRASWALDDDTLGQALYCLGFVLLLLRFYPSFQWLQRRPFLDKLITVINSRAMTIYLWGNIAIFAAGMLVSSRWMPTFVTFNDVTAGLSHFLLTLVVIAVAVLAVGWVEDVAAHRTPRLNPWPSTLPEHAAMTSGTLPRHTGAFPHRHITLPRPRLTGALLMAGLAAILTLLWTTSDHTGVTPQTTERGQTPITALGEQPAAPPAGTVFPNDTEEPVSGPEPSTASDTDQTSRPGDDLPSAVEEDVAIPDTAAIPEDVGDEPTQAGLEDTPAPAAAPAPSPTPQAAPTPAPAPAAAPAPSPTPTPTPQATPSPAPPSSTPTQSATPTSTPEATTNPPVTDESAGQTP